MSDDWTMTRIRTDRPLQAEVRGAADRLGWSTARTWRVLGEMHRGRILPDILDWIDRQAGGEGVTRE